MSLARGIHQHNGDATTGDEAQRWKRYNSVKYPTIDYNKAYTSEEYLCAEAETVATKASVQ